MNEERLQVLTMLAAGKINAQQANQLLEVLESGSASPPTVVAPFAPISPVAPIAPHFTPPPTVQPPIPPSMYFSMDRIESP